MALQQQDEDDLEENEPLIVLTGEHTAIHFNSSEEFIEARTVLQHDPWDVNAWLIFLEEAEVGKGGDISDVSAYQQFLVKFPRAARFWKRLAELQLSSGDFVSAGETLSSGAKQCWNVPLWDYYLDFLISNVSSYSSEKLQEAFEGSLEQIGFAHDSTGVWKKFLHHIQSGVDKGVCDINYLRSMYLKALNVPLENSDSIFADYEKFERTIQDPNFESYIAEGQKRFLHSKSILKERKKFVQEIVFERLSLPPSNTPNELSQLQMWNEWLSYELSHFTLSDENIRSLTLVYEQCLCCFYYNPEVWLSFSSCAKTYFKDNELARIILQKGIEVIPSSSLLLTGYAVLNEEMGNVNVAKKIYQDLFEKEQNSFFFSLYQKFLMRHLGLTAARIFFSSTYPLRSTNADLAVQLFEAHARFELEVCRKPDIAFTILQHAKSCKSKFSLGFIKLYVNVLKMLGKLNSARWLLNSSINHISFSTSSDSSIPFNPDIIDRTDEYQFAHTSIQYNDKVLLTPASLKILEELHQEYLLLEAEAVDSNLFFMDVLKKNLLIIQQSYFDAQKIRPTSILRNILGESALQLMETCRVLTHSAENAWGEIQGRCQKCSKSVETYNSFDEFSQFENKTSTQANSSALSVLPSVLRDFIVRLPFHAGPAPDIDTFLRQMKTVILPPRPLSEEVKPILIESKVGDDSLDVETNTQNDFVPDVYRKRQRVN